MCIPDVKNGQLYRQTRDTYDAAFTSKSKANRRNQAKAYLSFMISYKLNYMSPDLIDILMFVQFLTNSFKSPQTVKNYLSGAKTFVIEAGGNYQQFLASMVRNMVRGVDKLSKHCVTQAPALSVPFIKKVCDQLRLLSDIGRVAAAMVLFVFATYLRQSNVAYTPDGFNHMVKRSDISFSTNHMWIHVRSTKTIRSSKGVVIPVKRSNSVYCPVRAYEEALSLSRGSSNSYAFTEPGSNRPLYATKVNMLLRAVATSLRHPLAKAISLHSLRRSAAQACASLGISEEEIRDHGTWKSGAIYTYVPKIIFTKVPAAVASLLV